MPYKSSKYNGNTAQAIETGIKIQFRTQTQSSVSNCKAKGIRCDGNKYSIYLPHGLVLTPVSSAPY